MPSPREVDGFHLPFVIVSDEIFALKPWLMKPYGGKGLPQEEEIFNCRLSRCRRTIENSFWNSRSKMAHFPSTYQSKATDS